MLKNKSILFLIVVICIFIKEGNSQETLVWPPPPDKGRIRYLMEFRGREDVEPPKKENWFIRLLLGPREKKGPNFWKPHDISTDEEGRIYVTDTGYGRIFVFDFKNKKFSVIGEKGPFSLKKPIGISVSGNYIYVADAQLDRIVVYDKNGNFVMALGKPGELINPSGLEIDAKRKRIYVVDTKAHCVKIFDMDKNEKIAEWGKRGTNPGEFNFPTHIAVGEDGKVFVSDTGNFRYQVFSPDGKFLYAKGGPGDIFGKFARPKGIDVDWKGRVYVIDSMFCNYQIFDEKGQLLTFVGDCGGGPGRSMVPAGIHIDRKTRKIYVADQGNASVDVYEFFADDKD
jgi:DNA-binding beta-propeller fold protein YncE